MNFNICSFFKLHEGGLCTHICSLESAVRNELQVNDNVNVVYNIPLSILDKGKILTKAGLGKRSRLEVSLDSQIKNFKKLLKNDDLNEGVYHFHDVLSAYCFYKLGGDAKTILTVHGPLSKETKMMFPKEGSYIQRIKDIEKYVYERVNKIIAVDTGQKKIICDEYSINNSKVSVILNPVELPNKVSQDFRRFEGVEDSYIIPRRLVLKNGVHIAIEALTYNKNLKYIVCGDGPEMKNLVEMSNKLGVSKRVKFLGSVARDEVLSLVKNSKGIVIPSVPVEGVIEASSIAALEGMALSKIVFASDIGGLKEMIKNNKNGILFSNGNAIDLAKKISSFENLDTEERTRIITNGNLFAESRSYSNWFKEVKEVYDSINF